MAFRVTRSSKLPYRTQQRSITRLRVGLLAAMLIVLTGLSACGFELRKPAEIPLHLTPIHVEGETILRRKMHRLLAQNRITYTSDPGKASSTLYLNQVQFDSRDQSIAFDGRVAESHYLLSATARWTTRIQGKGIVELLPARSFTTERTLVINYDNRPAIQREQELIYAEMRENLAEQILDYLQYPGEAHSLGPSTSTAGNASAEDRKERAAP